MRIGTRRAALRSTYWMLVAMLPAIGLASPACDGGSVVLGNGSGSGGALPGCEGGLLECGAVCVDGRYDPQHCGACGNACSAGEVCGDGTCSQTCPGGTVQCGQSCIDTAHDPGHCGACGNACANGEVCSAGVCGVTCPEGTTQCGQTCVDAAVDPDNCGLCGNACPAGQICAEGTCALKCSGGTTLCGNVCVDLSVDPQHCGACGAACFPSASCAGGVCSINCNDAALNGYETDVDCGGSMCQPCDFGKICNVSSDCTTQTCSNSLCWHPADCAGVLAIDPAATSGLRQIDPDGPGGVSPFSAYCDMTTDGGGWTLVLAYLHSGGANNTLVLAPPQSAQTGHSHLDVQSLEAIDFSEIRLYCETSAHPRRIHFKANAGSAAFFRGSGANLPSHWNSGFAPLPGHGAHLPAATDYVSPNVVPQQRMTQHPFATYQEGYHWGIRSNGYRWECDDVADYGNTTLHQVWVR